MKKLLILFLALMLTFVFVSCSNESTDNIVSSESEEETVETSASVDLEADWTKTY